MPGRGDSSFPCVFPAAVTKAYESQQKQSEHVGSGWRAERIMGEGLGAAPGVPCREAIIRMQGSSLDVQGASISHIVWLLRLLSRCLEYLVEAFGAQRCKHFPSS